MPKRREGLCPEGRGPPPPVGGCFLLSAYGGPCWQTLCDLFVVCGWKQIHSQKRIRASFSELPNARAARPCVLLVICPDQIWAHNALSLHGQCIEQPAVAALHWAVICVPTAPTLDFERDTLPATLSAFATWFAAAWATELRRRSEAPTRSEPLPALFSPSWSWTWAIQIPTKFQWLVLHFFRFLFVFCHHYPRI